MRTFLDTETHNILLRVDLKMKFDVVIRMGRRMVCPCQAVSHLGKTVAKALENIKEAIKIDLEPEDRIMEVILCC